MLLLMKQMTPTGSGRATQRDMMCVSTCTIHMLLIQGAERIVFVYLSVDSSRGLSSYLELF